MSSMITTTKRGVVLALLAALLAVPLLTTFSSPASAEDDEDKNYSLYQVSSAVTAYFSNANSPEGDGIDDRWIYAHEDSETDGITGSPGEAGSLLGFADPDFSWSTEWLTSQVSGSSASVGYDTLVSSKGDDEDAFEGLLSYARYGATLNDLGLDSTSSGLGTGFIRLIAGGIIWLLFWIAWSVSWAMGFAISFLEMFNPFRLFVPAIRALPSEHANQFANGMAGGEGPPGALGSIADFIGEWYGLLHSLSWTVLVPIFLCLLLLGLLLFKNMNRGSAIKKFAIRLVFLGIGLPLLGSMYTQTLHAMGDAVSDDNAGAVKIVGSTYVDFESWALRTRLRVPEEATIAWDVSAQGASDESAMQARTNALAINKISHPGAFEDIHVSKIVDAESAWAQNEIDAGDGEASDTATDAVTDMLRRYMSVDSVEASSFETAVKGELTQWIGEDNERKEGAQVWFKEYADGIDNDEFIHPNNNPVIAISGGGLSSSDQGAQSGIEQFHSATTNDCGYQVADDNGQPLNCNLAVAALYNYLNTKFDSNALTVYSSEKATSGFQREQHNSVNQVGGFLTWVNSAVSLLCLAFLGWGYALAIMFSSVRRGLGVITAVPFATLGSIAGIAKVVTGTAMMLLELIATLFLYAFVSEMLLGLPQILEKPLIAALREDGLLGKLASTGDGGSAVVGGLIVLMSLLSTVTLIIFTVVAWTVRKAGVVRALDEAVTKFVGRLMDVDGGIPQAGGKGGVMPALAGGAAVGAGMAAASRIGGGGAPKSLGGGGNGVKGSSGPTNAGGTRGPKALCPGGDGPKGLAPGGGGPLGDSGGTAAELGGSSQEAARVSKTDKQIAQDIVSKGGLSRIGVDGKGGKGSAIKGAKGAKLGSKAGPHGAAAGAAAGAVAGKKLGTNGKGASSGGSSSGKPRKKLGAGAGAGSGTGQGNTSKSRGIKTSDQKPAQAPGGNAGGTQTPQQRRLRKAMSDPRVQAAAKGAIAGARGGGVAGAVGGAAGGAAVEHRGQKKDAKAAKKVRPAPGQNDRKGK